jgi:CopG family transcriptional regulator, nickel-responsive regulator
MSDVVRFGVSIEQELLKKFDAVLKEKKYTNRSEAFRDLIRQELITRQWQEGKECAGAIIIIYDHHKRELLNKMTDIQHEYQGIIISATHVHLDHDNCMEIIAVRGRPERVKKLADSLKTLKGVKHGVLSMTGTGAGI